MSYVVKCIAASSVTLPKQIETTSHDLNNWQPGQIDIVHANVISLYQANTSAFTILGIFTGNATGAQVPQPKSAVAVTTVGAATLTAAQLVAGNIMRSGSVGAYNDTTDTATNIVAAIPGAVVGSGFEFTIANSVAFVETLVAGSGVTLAGVTAVAASAARKYVATITNVTTPAVTITGVIAGTL